MDEPVADTVRGILDGHIVLSRRLAQRYHYPAVDVLKSVSRLVGSVTGPVTQKVMGYVRKVMAVYEENEDMITIGAYVKGSNPAVDEAIAKREAVEEFLVQAVEEKAPIVDTHEEAVVDRGHSACRPRRSRPTRARLSRAETRTGPRRSRGCGERGRGRLGEGPSGLGGVRVNGAGRGAPHGGER